MRIDQLTEEYTSGGRTVPSDVDLESFEENIKHDLEVFRNNTRLCN